LDVQEKYLKDCLNGQKSTGYNMGYMSFGGDNLIVDTNGDIYIIGTTKGVLESISDGKEDCFILHLDTEENQQNILQFGTSGNNHGYGKTVGQNSTIYACGVTNGDMVAKNVGKSDIFWGIFTKKLEHQDMKQFGTNEIDYAIEIKTDKKNIYIAGSTLCSAVNQ
jgi:hypothetical protein